LPFTDLYGPHIQRITIEVTRPSVLTQGWMPLVLHPLPAELVSPPAACTGIEHEQTPMAKTEPQHHGPRVTSAPTSVVPPGRIPPHVSLNTLEELTTDRGADPSTCTNYDRRCGWLAGLRALVLRRLAALVRPMMAAPPARNQSFNNWRRNLKTRIRT